MDMRISITALIISIVSLLISSAIAYFLYIHKGKIKITQPGIIGLAYESPDRTPKIVLSGLLYCTSEQGRMIENLYLKVIHHDRVFSFNKWVYQKEKVSLVGGLFVKKEGNSNYHHFLISTEEISSFRFYEGEICIQLNACIVNSNKPILLSSLNIFIDGDQLQSINSNRSLALYYWDPEIKEYREDEDSRSNNYQDWIKTIT